MTITTEEVEAIEAEQTRRFYLWLKLFWAVKAAGLLGLAFAVVAWLVTGSAWALAACILCGLLAGA